MRVAYENVSEAIDGVYIVLGKAEQHTDKITAIHLCKDVLFVALNLLEEADDSDGYIGHILSTTIGNIQYSIEGLEDSQYDYIEAFTIVFNEAMRSYYNGYIEWRFDLLEACIPLCSNKSNREFARKIFKRIP